MPSKSFQAGGSGPLMSPLPTKRLMSWEDIGTDHPDVPAFVFFWNSKGLSSEPPRPTWYICTVVTIWISLRLFLRWLESLFYSIWCGFRSRRSFGRTSIIRGVRRRLICFPSNLHVYRTQFLTDLFKDPFLSNVCVRRRLCVKASVCTSFSV